MRWAYDLIVLDSHGNFGKKVSEGLLDGILNLLECMVVFQVNLLTILILTQLDEAFKLNTHKD
jgi:hypothetical protein